MTTASDARSLDISSQIVLSPPMSTVVDYGIRGLHLALDLLEGVDLLVLVDAMATSDGAGTVCVLEPDPEGVDAEPLDAHRMDPHAVLRMVAELGGEVGSVVIVGCQPADIGEGIGLSPVVAAAVEPAVRVVRDFLAERNDQCSVA